jgi:SSS family solute:Na+ symporter
MLYYLWFILAYLVVLIGVNIWRARKVKTQEDFMVAGRKLSPMVMVFTLICTWIGSGTFIAGAEFAYKAGWSSLWMPAGAWVGILIIYFLSGKIRKFGQYTIGDILETRYNHWARLFGTVAIIISFTAIVSYQFRAGGYILNIVTNNKISIAEGQLMTASFVILYTALAGMIAVAYTDLSNGIVIVSATALALPFVYKLAGGWNGLVAKLPADHFAVVNAEFGNRPILEAVSYFLATFMLLLGVQSMYQKFYSARDAKAAKQSVALWIVGTIVVEVVVVGLAIFGHAVIPELARPDTIILEVAAKAVPAVIGILLLAAACVVVISTGNNYLLSPTTTVVRDIYQRFISPKASQKKILLLSKLVVIIIGISALIIAIYLTSVLKMARFAYTIYGVAITPALIAALAWKRANTAGAVTSIMLGTAVSLVLKIFGTPYGIPIIFPALAVSLISLIVVSLLTSPPPKEKLSPFFEGS